METKNIFNVTYVSQPQIKWVQLIGATPVSLATPMVFCILCDLAKRLGVFRIMFYYLNYANLYERCRYGAQGQCAVRGM